MEGLGFAASLIAVIQLADLCLKLSGQWLGPSEFGSTELAAITKNLHGLIRVMKLFQAHLRIHEDDEARLSSLEYLSHAFERCKEALQMVQDVMGNGGLIGKQVIGSTFDRKLKASLEALQGAQKEFELCLRADDQAILLGVERYIRTLAEDCRDFRDGVTAGLKQLHENGDKTYMEVKRGRKAQDEWQNTASEMALSIKAIVDRQDVRGDRKDRQAILDWLTPVDYAPQQTDFLHRREPDTGNWVLKSSEFQTWLQADKKTLFCPGMPGSGKTILASIVIDNLTTRFANDEGVGIAYIYFNFRRQDEQKANILFASLLKQLAQRILLPESVKSLHNKHKEMRTRPSLDEILRTLLSVAAIYSRVFIIVDALDECQTYDGYRTEFLSELLDFQAKCGANLFVTSRVIGEITEKFKGSISLEIRASDEDVQKYVNGHMSRLPQFVIDDPDLETETRTQIVKAVDGMFLLAQLHLDSLIGKRSPKALKTALAQLRTGTNAYDHAYNNAMERIEGQVTDHKELAKEVLMWILNARRPLTTVELQHALAVEVGEHKFDKENLPQIEDMVSVCAGLVTIDKESRIIRLVHYTTQEYLLRTQNKWFPNAQLNITITCVTYLAFDVFNGGFCESDYEFEERLRLNPLYDYAAHNWGHHARAAGNLCEAMIRFLTCDTNVEASSQALIAVDPSTADLNYSQKVPWGMTGLHLAAYFGLEKAVETLLARQRPDFKDCSGRTPLFYAAENGHKGVVQQLLLATGGADVNCEDGYGGTPLLWAAKNGHETVVELLLAQTGIKPDRTAPSSLECRTPLSFAAENGHKAVVELLLATGCVDRNSSPQTGFELWGLTPLSYAARNGHEAVVELLLAHPSVDLDSKSTNEVEYGRTPLSFAAENGHEAVVGLLLARPGVNPNSNATLWKGFPNIYNTATPLSLAAENGHDAVVRMLLATDTVNVNGIDVERQTALLLAAKNGKESVVQRLLVTNGIDVNYRDSEGSTALSLASKNGREAVIQLLLATGRYDINAKDSHGQTALSAAAINGHNTVVELMLAYKWIDLHLNDRYGRTLMLWAAQNGHDAVVKLLLARDRANLDSGHESDRTLLWWAAANGHGAVVKLLLTKDCIDQDSKDEISPVSPRGTIEHGLFRKVLATIDGVDVDSRDDEGQTPLHWAAKNGQEEVVNLLLQKDGIDPDCKDSSGRTPLLLAAEGGHEAVVRLLLDKGADIESKWKGQTPLLLAAWRGHEVVIRLLLKKGADVKTKWGEQTPLLLAVEGGHEAVVRLLLDTGKLDVNTNDYGRTPLLWAAELGHVAVVKVLLENGKVNVGLKDYSGRTALRCAIDAKAWAIVKLLQTEARLDKG